MGHIYLVRHGVTSWNRERRYQGSQDVPLAPEGVRQAERLAERLRGRRWDAVWTSDLARARETAAIIAPQAELLLEPAFREVGYGAWEGLTADEVRLRFPAEFAAYRSDPLAGAAPGGESPAELAARCLDAFRRLWHPGLRQVLLVAHGAVLKALVLVLLGADLRLRGRILLDNASLSVLRHEARGTWLVALNDTSHLESDRRQPG